MSLLGGVVAALRPLLPAVVAVVVAVAVLLTVRRLLDKRLEGKAARGLQIQLVTLALSFIGLLAVILALPLSDSARGQLLSLLGIVLSAAIALSSTTLLGNALAGIMLRMIRSFRGGDFLRVGEHFGRVAERGLFHVELQTEDRDLTTLPNLYLITQPVKVVRSSGTLVSATVSLGYDVPRGHVERTLVAAARAADLEEPFVRILELGDSSVVYRVAGLLLEVRNLLTAQSSLRANMLDELHRAGIEIVSPNFMNTRAVAEGRVFIPSPEAAEPAGAAPPAQVEELVFDKAEAAERIEELRQTHGELGERIEEIEERRKEADDVERARLDGELERLTAEKARLAETLEHGSAEEAKPG